MACGCNSTPKNPGVTIPSETGFPSIADYDAFNPVPICDGSEDTCNPSPVQPVCLSSANQASALGSPTQLDGTWLSPECQNENVTLLGRVGRTLTRFTGTGFLQLVNGKASIVKNLKLQVTQLFHTWWKPGSIPILGDPKPYPLELVADRLGTIYGIKGYETADSVKVWDYQKKEWAVRNIADFPILIRRVLPRTTSEGGFIELVGFAPAFEGNDPLTPRPLAALGGNGLVILTEIDTIPSECACEGCEPVAAKASVATTIAPPEFDPEYTSYLLGSIEGQIGFFTTQSVFNTSTNDFEVRLVQEVADREAGDAALAADLATETTARTTADTTLTNSVTAEANTRASQDALLQANIDAETAARIAYVLPGSSSANPVLSAIRVGQLHLNTTTKHMWIAVDIGGGSADWKQITA